MATIGNVRLTLSARKRWWFTIARYTLVALCYLRVIRDTDKAGSWLATHGMKLSVRQTNGG